MSARARRGAKSATRETMTHKESRFVAEYLIDLNATQAAKRAGYSARSARDIAGELLQRVIVRAAIVKAISERQARTLATADEVLLSIQRNAEKAEALLEFGAALRGLELLGRHQRLFTEMVRVGDPEGKPLAAPQIQPVFNITLTRDDE